MESDIIITKVVNGDEEEFDVKWILNLEKRIIQESDISYSLVEKIFKMKDIRDIKEVNLVLYSNDNNSYYCYNCIFGFKICPNFSIYTVSIDYILSNSNTSLDTLKVKEYEMILELPKEIKLNYIDEKIEFKYNKFIEIVIKREYNEKTKMITLNIISNKMMYARNLSNICYNIYELFIIYFGTGIKILSRRYYQYDNNYIEVLSNIANKYCYGIQNNIKSGIFIKINKNSINRDVLKKFGDFKRKTYLLNDVYLTITNTDTYKEIKINMMIQCIEGFYRSITGSKEELYVILENVFLKNNYYNKILSNKDKRKVKVDNRSETIFLFKAKNHRHYFSHLNENKRKSLFNDLQLNYAYWKIVIAYRLMLIKYLDIQYDKELLDKIIFDINEYKEKYC